MKQITFGDVHLNGGRSYPRRRGLASLATRAKVATMRAPARMVPLRLPATFELPPRR